MGVLNCTIRGAAYVPAAGLKLGPEKLVLASVKVTLGLVPAVAVIVLLPAVLAV